MEKVYFEVGRSTTLSIAYCDKSFLSGLVYLPVAFSCNTAPAARCLMSTRCTTSNSSPESLKRHYASSAEVSIRLRIRLRTSWPLSVVKRFVS